MMWWSDDVSSSGRRYNIAILVRATCSVSVHVDFAA